MVLGSKTTWGQRLRYLWGHPDWEAPGAATQSNRPEIQTTGPPLFSVNIRRLSV